MSRTGSEEKNMTVVDLVFRIDPRFERGGEQLERRKESYRAAAITGLIASNSLISPEEVADGAAHVVDSTITRELRDAILELCEGAHVIGGSDPGFSPDDCIGPAKLLGIEINAYGEFLYQILDMDGGEHFFPFLRVVSGELITCGGKVFTVD